jgi:pilus assembly protein Flp/PilA
MRKLNRLAKDERAATAIEYGLLLALISIVMLGVLNSLGFTLAGVFERISTAMSGG